MLLHFTPARTRHRPNSSTPLGATLFATHHSLGSRFNAWPLLPLSLADDALNTTTISFLTPLSYFASSHNTAKRDRSYQELKISICTSLTQPWSAHLVSSVSPFLQATPVASTLENLESMTFCWKTVVNIQARTMSSFAQTCRQDGESSR